MTEHHLAYLSIGVWACIVCNKMFEDEAMAATVDCVSPEALRGMWHHPVSSWPKPDLSRADDDFTKAVRDEIMRKIQGDIERRLIDPHEAMGRELLRRAGLDRDEESET